FRGGFLAGQQRPVRQGDKRSAAWRRRAMMDGLPESSQKAGDIGVFAGQYNLCCVSPLSFYATQGSLSSPGDTQRCS
ncbi:hypothetical protein, partial [Thiolapillus sp.]|uniref:hypothetical protein n=2 Tax=Thiolapillus sp. TaxID=2017437 RepID=UPI003AF48C07